MHFYKRELSPIRETFVMLKKGSPYKKNFEQYEVNIATKDFKRNLLNSMGENVKCVTSYTKNNR